MREIGGFFALDLPPRNTLHAGALHFNTARNALHALLSTLLARPEPPRRMLLPVLNCPDVEAMLVERFPALDLHFYNVDDALAPVLDDAPQPADLLYLVDLFGLNAAVTQTAPAGAIVDNVHSLFRPARPGTHTLYSVRKFFGVADGAFLQTGMAVPQPDAGEGWTHAGHLLKRTDLGAQVAYGDYVEVERRLAAARPAGMSALSQALFEAIDIDATIAARRDNFRHLHAVLGTGNALGARIDDCLGDPHFVPFSYPYLTDDGPMLRQALIGHRVYVPTLWKEIAEDRRATAFERRIARDTVHLPIDQRYGLDDMQTVLSHIQAG